MEGGRRWVKDVWLVVAVVVIEGVLVFVQIYSD